MRLNWLAALCATGMLALASSQANELAPQIGNYNIDNLPQLNAQGITVPSVNLNAGGTYNLGGSILLSTLSASYAGSAPIFAGGGASPSCAANTCTVLLGVGAGAALSTSEFLPVAIGFHALGSQSAFTTFGAEDTAIGWNALGNINQEAGLNTAVGINAIGAATTGVGNTAMGTDAMRNAKTPNADTAIGARALQNDIGTTGQNTAVGDAALQGAGAGITGANNTGVGYAALFPLSTGFNNTGIGSNALITVTTGHDNAALGYQAAPNLSTSNFNTCVGTGACLSVNTGTGHGTAVGYESLALVTTGANNVGIGYLAGLILSTGSSNVIIGPSVGNTTLATGSSNILVGTSSGVDTPAAATSNYLNIGNQIVGDTSKGILIYRGPAATLSACGTSPALTTGSNDMAGEVTTGTAAPTACTVAFANTHTAAPACIVTPEFAAATATIYVSAISGTGFTITASAGLTSQKFMYQCAGYSTATNPTP